MVFLWEWAMCWGEKYCVSAVIGWIISIRFIWSIVQSKSNVSLLIFCQKLCQMLKVGCGRLIIILLGSISLFSSLVFPLYICMSQCWVYTYLKLLFPLSELNPLSLYNNLSWLFYTFVLKFIFVWYKYSYSCSFLVSISMDYHLPSLYIQSMCVFIGDVCFL